MTREITRRSTTPRVASAAPCLPLNAAGGNGSLKTHSLEEEMVLRSSRPFDPDKKSWILSTAADEKTLTNKDQFVKG